MVWCCIQFKVKAGGGNLDFYEFAALANGPLSDHLAGKVSLSHKRRDGYIEDRFNGLDYNDINTYSLRGQLMHQAYIKHGNTLTES